MLILFFCWNSGEVFFHGGVAPVASQVAKSRSEECVVKPRKRPGIQNVATAAKKNVHGEYWIWYGLANWPPIIPVKMHMLSHFLGAPIVKLPMHAKDH